MFKRLVLLLIAALALGAGAVGWPASDAAAADYEIVHFPSLNDHGPGQPSTTLDGYLFRPAMPGPRPALVFLHGCGGMFSHATGFIDKREIAWAVEFVRRGYGVLMVDSFGPRNQGEMCSSAGFDREIYRQRPDDAYGALLYLQAQAFTRADRIGLVGWSEGGGALLNAIGVPSLGRPERLPRGDFRAAVAFYPASCRDRPEQPAWRSPIPMLVLIGALDVWTPAAPCKAFLDGAVARGTPVAMQIYPAAYHDFDWPGMAVRYRPEYRTRDGTVPITGTDPAARQDALARVPDFFARLLLDGGAGGGPGR